jgi:hypothetical protein
LQRDLAVDYLNRNPELAPPASAADSRVDKLYSELKPDVEALTDPLFSASEAFLRKRGGFVPHGAVLDADGSVRLMMAAPEGDPDLVSPAEVLPYLHSALREDARDERAMAVAVCEDVTITLPGEKQTRAIKVLIEHRRGLSVALYLPWKRNLMRRVAVGHVLAVAAQPEVRPWGNVGAA